MTTVSSMTGYGEGRAEDDRVRVSVAIRCVNHRFLDLALRLPDAYRSFELELAALVKQRVLRGRLEARYRIDPVEDPELEVKVRTAVARSYREAAKRLAAQAQDRAEGSSLAEEVLSVADLLRLPEVVSVEAPADEPGQGDGEILLQATAAALDGVVASRLEEGAHLEAALRRRLEDLERLREELSASAVEIQRGLARSLEQRLADLLDDKALDPARLAQEVAVLADRSDVREELDRLAAHLAAFGELLGGEGARGKRLDFLTQEILRELNTLGAKCRHSGQLERVVEAKVACEQLREQVQNIE